MLFIELKNLNGTKVIFSLKCILMFVTLLKVIITRSNMNFYFTIKSTENIIVFSLVF